MSSTDETKCRLCLEDQTSNAKMFDLFLENDTDVKFYEKIEYCCGVKIRQSEEMPSKICIKCFDMTRMWFNFRQMVLNSQVYLESLCSDRVRPKGFENDNYDENAYLDYLLKDLQIKRFAVKNEKLDNVLIGAENSENDEQEAEYEDVYLNEIENDGEAGVGDGDSEYIETYDSIQLDQEDCDNEMEIDALEMESEEEWLPEKIDDTRRHQEQVKSKTAPAPKNQRRIPKKLLRPPSPNTYMCSICGNVYNKKASFKYHMTLHSDVKSHKCELCGKAFRQVSELNNHMRRHTGEKPYKCSYCDRRFVDRSEKHRHERVHTNSRPYVCKVCNKSFTYSASLKNHSKLHSGEKDYSCLVCEKAFALQHQLKAHLQTLTHKQKESHFVSAGYSVVYE